MAFRLSLAETPARKTLKGKSWDLQRAYKQVPLSKSSLQDSYLAVLNPNTLQVEIYGQYVLPFSSTASVNSFGRLAVCLKVHRSAYFDDFVCFDQDELTDHTSWLIDTFFRLTGWQVSADKEFPFGLELVALGLVIDLSGVSGLIRLGNTEKRKSEIMAELDAVMSRQFVTATEWLSLRGRLQYCESQLCGRRSVLAVCVITRHAESGGGKIGGKTKEAFEFLRDWVETMGPRTVTSDASAVLHLSVDACCEQAHKFPAGLGGVLVLPDEGILGHYSLMLSKGHWEPESGLDVWSSELRGKNVVVFTDNQAAQASFVKCFTENPVAMGVVISSCRLEEDLEIACWYERVNTASNVADEPDESDIFDTHGYGIQHGYGIHQGYGQRP